jgi:hypothetical protein
LKDNEALSREAVKKLVSVCRKNHIRIIPHINLLGHQSWAGTTGNLLRQYPEFDETPGVKMPSKYKWPNPHGLYCKSYCADHGLPGAACFGATTMHRRCPLSGLPTPDFSPAREPEALLASSNPFQPGSGSKVDSGIGS